ncbi:glycosyltransferase family protein [Algoriphagus chordae]|uniref:Glycosyltransferase involved in cell wall biosynthesis n=1 Tax=Algoriphagus chordae TaxID=237019 RepID=A0A2W7RAR2_9BACT|nr:hypothetical protein [Algoriphagus chordae]PZX47695.1 hypothetical protein LV85_03885 [Algoriphagus chordae]
MKTKVLIISYSNFASDPRVLRQLQILGADHEIMEAGRQASGQGNSFVQLKEIQAFHVEYPYFIKKGLSLFFKLYRENLLLKVFKKYEQYYWDFLRVNVKSKLVDFNPKVVIANDIDALPLAVAIKEKTGAKVILDAHEFSPLQMTNLEHWEKYISPYKYYLSEKYIPFTDYCFTVSKGIAEEYESLAGKPFSIFRNSPRFIDLEPSAVENDKIQLIHHGAAIPGRNLELMFDIIAFLDERFVLNLILIPTVPEYYSKLVERAKNSKKIVIHSPVPTEEIPMFINQFDLGIFILPPSNFNYKHALPNKFFEFIQGRLGVAIGPSVEMSPYVKQYDLGVVASDFSAESIAVLLNSLDKSQVEAFKMNAHLAAKELAIDKELAYFHKVVNEIA